MKRAFLCLLLPLGLCAADEAQACRIPPRPIIPIAASLTYDAVAFATVTGDGNAALNVRIDELVEGRVDSAVLPLVRIPGPNEIVITCGGFARSQVAPGDRVVVVIGRFEGGQGVLGWTTLELAALLDDFFRLYPAERSAVARRRLRERWKQVNRFGGPIPLTDASRWMAPFAGGLGYTGGGERTRAIFQVGPDGRVTGCETERMRAATPRDHWVCDRLRRQRFRPPVLARERGGLYEVRWNAEIRPPR